MALPIFIKHKLGKKFLARTIRSKIIKKFEEEYDHELLLIEVVVKNRAGMQIKI